MIEGAGRNVGERKEGREEGMQRGVNEDKWSEGGRRERGKESNVTLLHEWKEAE